MPLRWGYMYLIMKKNCIKSDFKDVFFKLATNEWSDKTYLLTSKLCPLGAVCPLLMNIYCIKSDFKEIFWNLQHMTEVTRGSCWHQNFVPKELSAPSLGIYTCIKSWKKLYKIIQRVFFFVFLTCSKWSEWQEVSVDIKILSPGPLGLSAPDLWLYTFIKSWKDVYKVGGWRDSF